MGKEDIPNKIEVSEEELIKSLKERGIHDVTAMTLLDRWTAQEEATVGKDPLDSIKFNQRRARIYLMAGYKEEALDNLEDAAIQAVNENRRELRQQIIAEMERIVNSM
ncbi:MAG TPA: hypothetical protein VJK04_04275 [Candidatus Paceibacterota bacterium]